jgi:hypothetical protein
MPALRKGTTAEGRIFGGSDGDKEILDPRTYIYSFVWENESNYLGYHKRPDAKNFFTRGRVSIPMQLRL